MVKKYLDDNITEAPNDELMEQDLQNSDLDTEAAKQESKTDDTKEATKPESTSTPNSHRWIDKFKGKKRKVVIPSPIEDFHKEALALLPKVDRAPFVGLGNLNTSSVDLTVRAWTRSEHYWGVFYTMNERFYKELPPLGINFPFPQLDVHLNPGEQTPPKS